MVKLSLEAEGTVIQFDYYKISLGCKINKITQASYTAVSLGKYRKRTFQNRLWLVKTDVKKINISRWKHMSLIYKKYLKEYLRLLQCNNFTTC